MQRHNRRQRQQRPGLASTIVVPASNNDPALTLPPRKQTYPEPCITVVRNGTYFANAVARAHKRNVRATAPSPAAASPAAAAAAPTPLKPTNNATNTTAHSSLPAPKTRMVTRNMSCVHYSPAYTCVMCTAVVHVHAKEQARQDTFLCKRCRTHYPPHPVFKCGTCAMLTAHFMCMYCKRPVCASHSPNNEQRHCNKCPEFFENCRDCDRTPSPTQQAPPPPYQRNDRPYDRERERSPRGRGRAPVRGRSPMRRQSPVRRQYRAPPSPPPPRNRGYSPLPRRQQQQQQQSSPMQNTSHAVAIVCAVPSPPRTPTNAASVAVVASCASPVYSDTLSADDSDHDDEAETLRRVLGNGHYSPVPAIVADVAAVTTTEPDPTPMASEFDEDLYYQYYA